MKYHPDLQCDVKGISYDFKTQTGRLLMGAGQSCEFTGCIGFFEKIDLEVSRIYTFAGGAPDTVYFRENGQWSAKLSTEPKTKS